MDYGLVFWPATLKQGTQTKLLEGQGPAEFTFNPNETHLIQQIKFLRKRHGMYVGTGLELNSAGLWPSSN